MRRLLDAVEPLEIGAEVPNTWATEARLWVELLLNRLQFGDGGQE